jgi:hypothetical protein
MKQPLPSLIYKDLAPTRNYLQEVALTLSALQRLFVPKNPHQWQYGLGVNVRGLVTQPFQVNGQATQASLDLVRCKVRLGGRSWSLQEHTPQEIFQAIAEWLSDQGATETLHPQKFTTSIHDFDRSQADSYAAALWWMDNQFRSLKTTIEEGVTSPVLIYPHHFDLSLTWFPHDNEQQLAIGFSSGDETIAEPYLYFSAYPEPVGFNKLKLSDQAYYQTAGFSAAILPYAALSSSPDPIKLFRNYALHGLMAARPLLD